MTVMADSSDRSVFGIDLGTTNSVIAVVRDGTPQVIEFEGESIMPSVVGLSPDGRLLVGTPARNAWVAYPDRTVASIKRMMGSTDKVRLGDRTMTPPEVSAVILQELVRRARAVTGIDTNRVVVTVPAFFQDAQRAATRLAGEIAGLEVVRIVNEPTAAALAFEGGDGNGERLLVVYDLGGGTFDVSVVRTDGTLTEVLASHGDVHLGGDDFDRAIADALLRRHDPRSEPDAVARNRLIRACELAKIRLTEDTSTVVREEFFDHDAAGAPRHLVQELERDDFEGMIMPFLERSLDSVHQALELAGVPFDRVDDVLLVGGSTRTPLVGERLRELFGRAPRRDIHPDLSVALGAAIEGARAAGMDTGRVLVDVTPYSFGPAHVGLLDGEQVSHAYTPLIERGTPLPVTRSETFYTLYDDQTGWDVRIYQGESPDARDNVLVGRFLVDGLAKRPAGNPLVCRMRLGLDGILDVEVVEKATGIARQTRIEGATARLSARELEAARARNAELWGERDEPDEDDAGDAPAPAAALPSADADAVEALLARGNELRARMTAEDRVEFAELAASLERAIANGEEAAWRPLLEELADLVHYVEEA
jgi:molecular chaperone DnaK (HSP70)